MLDAVFAPEIDATVARLEAELRDLERQLEQKRALARQAAGGRARGETDVDAPMDRAA